MAVAVRLDRDLDIVHWRPAFLVLGVRRCQPSLLLAGVPPEIAASPEEVVEAVRHFFRAKEELRPRNSEGDRLALIALLEGVFAAVSNAYGEAAAQSLYDWVQRHFVDHQQIGCWSDWATLLSCACAADDSRPATIPFPAEIAGAVQEVTCKYFGPDAEAESDEHLARARTIPLSPLEQGLVALEVTQPTDFHETDVVEVLERVLYNQRAYQVWLGLDQRFDEAQREALLWWGYEQAAFLGMPAGEVVLPARTAK